MSSSALIKACILRVAYVELEKDTLPTAYDISENQVIRESSLYNFPKA